MMDDDLLWWQKGIIYQIYPRSFQDSDGDGIGDLPGIISRLDYLTGLGIDAIWLSPIFPSPMADFGYDVADYVDIHPMFGSMADFDRLLAEAHKRGIKIILDFVPNHTSSEHEWFKESRSSRNNARRDWYIWRDPAADGGPPNNWLSFFGGPAWTFDETTGQYYLHQFVRQQPELNYRHPEVLPAMLDNMRFWLEKGVDGFRVDVIWLMLKDEELRDEPPNPEWDGVDPFGSLIHTYTHNLPGVHELIREMRRVLDEYDERMMVGEIYLPNEDLMLYYGRNGDECHMPYNFQLIDLPWQADVVRKAVDAYEAVLPQGAWPNWVTGNHDQPRVASRVGRDQARIAAMLLLTLRGTPTTYYGEEIGMENVRIPPELVQDPPAVMQPEIADLIGRDPERTPMQWDDSEFAGFTSAKGGPWLPVAENYQEINAARLKEDPFSLLNLYRLLAHLRRSEAALHGGSYASLDSGKDDVFAYIRWHDGADSFVIVLNFGKEHREIDLGEQVSGRATIAISSFMDRAGRIELSSFNLAPNEGLVLRLIE
jgi:alpha-glucosidase